MQARPHVGHATVCGFNNRNAQKCAIAHLIQHSGLPELAIERRWGSDRVAPPTVAGWCVRWYMHIVEPWRLFLLSSASLCGAGVESTGAHCMRTCRPLRCRRRPLCRIVHRPGLTAAAVRSLPAGVRARACAAAKRLRPREGRFPLRRSRGRGITRGVILLYHIQEDAQRQRVRERVCCHGPHPFRI